MKNFFERDYANSYKTSFLPKIKDKLNLSNFDLLSKKQIQNFLHYGEEANFLSYRFYILKQWMKKNERYTRAYVYELEQAINKLFLNSELNSFERQYILNVNDITFAKTRNLKQLIVDFSINYKELVFYRYEIDNFVEIRKEKEFIILNACDFYITTQRIIISKQIDIISIGYSQIKNFEFRRNRITFILKNGKNYYIKCNNTYLIYASLERVLKREKIVFNS